MGLTLLRSPLLPLAAAIAIFLSRLRGSGAASIAILLYLVRSLWKWWASLTISVNNLEYKAAFGSKPSVVLKKDAASSEQGRRHSKELRLSQESKASDGFLTPRDGNSSVAAKEVQRGPAGRDEWAMFAPSLPFGKPHGPPIAGADCAPYWLECEASAFDVRNIGYKQTKEKVPSDVAMYDCVGNDIVRDARKIESLIDRMPSGKELPASHPNAVAWDPSWGVPRVVIVNCQLPYKAGNISTIFGAHPEDDGGLSVCSYFVLSCSTCELLGADSWTPSLGLLRRFVEEGTSTKAGISFKVVGRVEDLEKYDIPKQFHSFNNKPVLLTGSAKVLTHRLPEVLEIDYDVRSWVYAARLALVNYHQRAREAELEIGYLIEGKSDDELPEQILGCFKLNDMDIMAAVRHSVM